MVLLALAAPTTQSLVASWVALEVQPHGSTADHRRKVGKRHSGKYDRSKIDD